MNEGVVVELDVGWFVMHSIDEHGQNLCAGGME
jgi:hypothetical protein